MWPNKWDVNQHACWKKDFLLSFSLFQTICESNNFQELQILIQNCLHWLGKSIFRSYIQETFAETTYDLH